ncbi:hypothetical protein [Pelagerythrobacter rhizovicinus]|uniref:Energy transducer TonB n=1 Tax=Pelagerythrobacter rhizovicinus TaxID=2268576 RepID=A0A4Q2KKG2_9SPHN|nr:hypothetical protein [Pelagerythrobacter rhizovicinus]RXZ64847.1 hypothetical protein ETX26_13420 [Pelagerythrobacter rhizovicinus]
MSRNHLALALLFGTAPLAAQTADRDPGTTDPVEEAFDAARDAYGPPPPAPPQPDCEQPEGNEIVVCARLEEQSQFRIRSDEDAENEYAAATMNKGDPKAPDVSGPGIFKGPATVSGLCVIPPCPEPPAYMIDFDELPEAPPGSDAERVGRGLAPRGYDGEFEPEEDEEATEPESDPPPQ